MTRLAFVQVCDDFAVAPNGKLNFMGMYGSDLLVPRIPASLPKLCFAVTLRSPSEDPHKRMKVRVQRPGLDEYVNDRGEVQQPADRKEGIKFRATRLLFSIEPFEIKEAGVVRVFVDDERETHYAGGLRVIEGVVLEQIAGPVAGAANVVGAHLERVQRAAPDLAAPAALQLVETLSTFMRAFGYAPKLQGPNDDVRMQISDTTVRVFFPVPMRAVPTVTPKPLSDGATFAATDVDRLGFTAVFARVPDDMAFDYEASAEL